MPPREARQQGNDTYTTDRVVQELSEGQVEMADDIDEIKRQLEQAAFAKKICETIKESDSLKDCIKGVVWKTIREKAWALVVAGVILAVTVFSKELISLSMKHAAEREANQVFDQRGARQWSSSSSL